MPIEIALTPEELAFYKKYKLPLPKSKLTSVGGHPRLRPPGMAANMLRDGTVKKTKAGMIDKRDSAFDEIMKVVTMEQKTGFPKRLPSGDIDIGKNMPFPTPAPGKNRDYKRIKTFNEIMQSPEPVIKKADGTYTFMDMPPEEVREFADPLYSSKNPEDVKKRLRLEVEQGQKPINVPGIEQDFYDTFFPEAEPRETGASVVPPKSGFDQFNDLIKQGELGMPEFPSRGAEQAGAGLLAMPGEVVYGTTGMALKGAELAADYVNRKVSIKNQSLSNLITGKPTSHFDFGSKYYFDKASGVTKAAEQTLGAEPIRDVTDNFYRNLGANIPFLATPLVALSGTVVGTAIGDIVYDLTDPKYKSYFDVIERKPSSKKPELQPDAEVGIVEGDEVSSSAYQVLGNWPWIVIAGAATLGGYRTIRQAFKVPTPRITRVDPALQPERSPPLPKDFVPSEPIRSITKPGVAVQSMQQDANAIVRFHARRAAGPRPDDAATLSYLDELGTQTHVAGQETAMATVKTGRFITPTRIIEGPSPYVLREAHRKLPPEQQELFNQGMLAADKIDDMNNGKSAYTVGMTMEDAQAKVQQMRADPILAGLEAEYRKVTQNLLDFETDAGMIDPIFNQTLSRARPGFMPNVSVDDGIDGNIWQQFKEAIVRDPGKQDEDFRMLPTVHRRDEDVAPRNYVPPMDALMMQVQHMVQFTNQNRLRKKLITDMLHSSDEAVRKSVRQIIPGHNQGYEVDEARTTGYYINGEKMRFEVADPMLAKALEFAPSTAMFPAMNSFRRYTQFFLTYINPQFAPVVFLREAAQSTVFRPADRSFGYADRLTKLMTGGRAGIRGDMTGLAGALFNIPKDLVPRAMLNVSQHIHANLMSGNKPFWGQLDNMFGPGSSLAVADRMRNSYITSMRGILDAYGGYNVKMTNLGIGESLSAIEKASGAWESKFGSSSMSAFRAYQAGISSLHNASRLYYFAQNYHTGMSIADARKLALETQRLTGDLRIRGLGASASKLKQADSTNEAVRRGFANALNQGASSRVGRLAIESSLYGNPIVQGLAKVTTALKSDASGFSMGLFNLIAVPSVATLTMAAYLDFDDPEAGYMDHFFNRRAEWKKVSSIPVYIPGLPPELAPEIQIDPTIGIFNYGTASIIDQIVSARDWNPELNELGLAVPPANKMIRRSAAQEGGRQVWSAIGATIGMSLPMPVALLNALQGYDTFNSGGPGYGTLYKQQEESLSGGGGITGKKEVDNVLPLWAQSLVQEAHGSMGAFATSLLDAGVAGYGEDGVRTAMEAIQIQAQHEALKAFHIAAPITGYHTEYTSRESDIKYEKQRAADNLAEVIQKQLVHPGEIRKKAAGGVEGIITDDAMKGLNTLPANAGVALNPIRNEVFKKAAPMILDYVGTNEKGIKDVIAALSTIRTLQKDLRAVNAGNMHMFPKLKESLKGQGTLNSLKKIQTRVNELEIIKRKLNIRYIEIISELEQQLGMKIEDVDPYKEVMLPPEAVQP